MHETMVAQSLLAAIEGEAAKQNAKPVSAKISCGTFNALNEDIFCFAFESLAKGTACEGVELTIEHKPIRGKCKNCTTEFDIELSSPACPKCSGEQFELLPDEPLILEEIEFDTEQSNV